MEIAFLKSYNAVKKLSIMGFELTPQVKRYTHLNNCVMKSSLVMSNNLNIAKCGQLLIEMSTPLTNEGFVPKWLMSLLFLPSV